MHRFFLLLCAVVIGGTAQAQTVQTAYAGGNPAVLTIPVTASISPLCGFASGAAPSGTRNQANFDQTGLALQFDFSLNCTGPSRVAVQSTNGGLLSTVAAPSGYANKADYIVTLNLAATGGTTATAACAASILATSGSCSFAGPATTTQGLRLGAPAVNQAGSYVRITAPAQTGTTVLVAGTYSDALTITVSPSL